MLNHAWFSNLQQRYNIDKKQGVIVGFIDSEEQFNVYLDETVRDFRVLYFDARGEIIKNEDPTRQKAGFIYYNTGTGLHTVMIESGIGQILSELTYVDPDAVAVFYKAIY